MYQLLPHLSIFPTIILVFSKKNSTSSHFFLSFFFLLFFLFLFFYFFSLNTFFLTDACLLSLDISRVSLSRTLHSCVRCYLLDQLVRRGLHLSMGRRRQQLRRVASRSADRGRDLWEAAAQAPRVERRTRATARPDDMSISVWPAIDELWGGVEGGGAATTTCVRVVVGGCEAVSLRAAAVGAAAAAHSSSLPRPLAIVDLNFVIVDLACWSSIWVFVLWFVLVVTQFGLFLLWFGFLESPFCHCRCCSLCSCVAVTVTTILVTSNVGWARWQALRHVCVVAMSPHLTSTGAKWMIAILVAIPTAAKQKNAIFVPCLV